MTKRIMYSRWPLTLVGAFAIALWVAWAWYVIDRFPEGAKLSPETQQVLAARGQFGDMFGGITALFTALILAGAIYAVWLQHTELQALKQQQHETRVENSRTALLLAYTAVVNAQSGLLNARYQLTKDLATGTKEVDPQSEQAGTLLLMLQANASAAGNVMTDLEGIVKELSAVIAEVKLRGTTDGV